MIKVWFYGDDETTAIELPGDEWFKDLAKVRPVISRKALDGTPYSYVQRERGTGTLLERTVSFAHLDKEKAAALHTFLAGAEGRLCLLRDGKGQINVVHLVPDGIAITSTTRAARRDDQNRTIEDYWHQAAFKVRILLTETGYIA